MAGLQERQAADRGHPTDGLEQAGRVRPVVVERQAPEWPGEAQPKGERAQPVAEDREAHLAER